MLNEAEVYSLLKSHGIDVPRFRVFKREEELDWDLFPAVIKILSPAHKSERGGVLAVNDKKELDRAFERLKERFPDQEEFIVEEKLEGIEAFVGIKRDPSFSHVIGIGTGGILVELLKDVVFIPLSASREETLNQIKKTELYRLIEGFRSYKGNLDLFLNFIEKLKALLKERPEIYEMDLNPTFISENRVVPADGRAVFRKPEKKRPFEPLPRGIFRPKSIAVVGASNNPEKVGYALLRNLELFKGSVYPVNPKYSELFGRKCYRSVLDIPDPVDCALIAVPSKAVPDVVEECGRKGVKLAVVISAGFSEVGSEGKKLEEELRRRAGKWKVRVLGPNTLGFIVPGLKLNASFSQLMPPPGRVSLLSQSGALITALIDRAVEERNGFSEIVSLGNQADIEITETFELAARDPETSVILSYVEGVELGEKLLEFLNLKPAVFLKVGRSESGRGAAASHTGSLAGDYRVFRDCVECKGGIVVETVEEAFDCTQFLLSYGRVSGESILIVTNAGGPGALASDYAELLGLKVAELGKAVEELSRFLPDNWSKRNPVDLIGDATSHRFRKAFEILKEVESWNFGVVIVTPQSMTDVPRIAHEIARFQKLSERPVVAVLMGGYSVKHGAEILKREGIPVYPEPFRAINAIRRGVWNVQS